MRPHGHPGPDLPGDWVLDWTPVEHFCNDGSDLYFLLGVSNAVLVVEADRCSKRTLSRGAGDLFPSGGYLPGPVDPSGLLALPRLAFRECNEAEVIAESGAYGYGTPEWPY